MKSKVLTMFPYQEVDFTRFKRSPKIDEAALQKELDRVAYPYITWLDGDTIHAGDVVQCSLASDDPRYQRSGAKLTVGAGLLDRAAENALIGRHVGATLELVCRGSRVTATVLGIQNKQVPPVSDEMVAALGMDGVDTVEGYRNYLVRQALDEQFRNESYEVIQYVLGVVRERSQVLIDEADWQQSVAWDLNRLSVIAGFEGLDLKTMTAREFEGRIPVKSYQELVAQLQRDAWENTRQMLFGRKLAETDGFAVDQAGYETFLIDTAASWGSTAEQYRPAYPYAYYEAIQYRNHYYNAVRDYIRENIYWEE